MRLKLEVKFRTAFNTRQVWIIHTLDRYEVIWICTNALHITKVFMWTLTAFILIESLSILVFLNQFHTFVHRVSEDLVIFLCISLFLCIIFDFGKGVPKIWIIQEYKNCNVRDCSLSQKSFTWLKIQKKMGVLREIGWYIL